MQAGKKVGANMDKQREEEEREGEEVNFMDGKFGHDFVNQANYQY